MNRAERLIHVAKKPSRRIIGLIDVYEASEAKEAMAMIANDSVYGLHTDVAGATGGRPAILGKICL